MVAEAKDLKPRRVRVFKYIANPLVPWPSCEPPAPAPVLSLGPVVARRATARGGDRRPDRVTGTPLSGKTTVLRPRPPAHGLGCPAWMRNAARGLFHNPPEVGKISLFEEVFW
ncbi:hypothetical protein Plo01_50720 [Planobispora longispora]|uniref:Uncharacterized protein n=1 Tax=Planobispora longispora TaxID=28887 RepID=A0A8J3RUV3_9ACTN|nr:hypothetical protein Plo01_50720 [Planobispora longispora]